MTDWRSWLSCLAVLACARHESPSKPSASQRPNSASASASRAGFQIAGGSDTLCFRVGNLGIECQGAHEGFFEGAVNAVLGIGSGCIESARGSWSCWGLYDRFQLEQAPKDFAAPGADRVELPALQGMTTLSLQAISYCGLRSGKALCWGSSHVGVLGYTTDEACEYKGDTWLGCSHVPREVPGLAHVIDVVLSASGGCALTEDGGVSCWGRLTSEWYPHPPLWEDCTKGGDASDRKLARCSPPPPRRVARLPPIVQLARPQAEALFALGRDGRVYYWEGYGDPDPPRAVEGIEQAVKIAANAWRVCAVLSSGRVLCAEGSPSSNEHCKELRQKEWVMSAAEVVSRVGDARDIAVTNNYRCVVRATGRVACWEGSGARPNLELVEVRSRASSGTAGEPAPQRLRF